MYASGNCNSHDPFPIPRFTDENFDKKNIRYEQKVCSSNSHYNADDLHPILNDCSIVAKSLKKYTHSKKMKEMVR